MNDQSEKKPSTGRKILFFILSTVFILVLIPLVWIFILSPRGDIERLNSEYVSVTFDEKVNYEFVNKRPGNWATINEISPHAKNAIVISEDWAFFEHKGVDYNQIIQAVEDAQEGKKLRGASTISQQLIKNLFLTSDRSMMRKIKEFVLVSHLEKHVPKEKILETYLNVIEFGEGIYGIKAASRHYFNKHPSQLTPREGAFLAMLLPSPKKYSSSFREKKVSPFAKETVEEILDKMAIAGHLKKEEVERFKNQLFNWENELERSQLEENRPRQKKNGPNIKPVRNPKRAKLSPPKDFEDRYRNDKDLELDDNLEYDDDAILEDTSGLKEEFSVE